LTQFLIHLALICSQSKPFCSHFQHPQNFQPKYLIWIISHLEKVVKTLTIVVYLKVKGYTGRFFSQ